MKNSFFKQRGFASFAMLFALILTTNQIAFSQYVCLPAGNVTATGSLTTTDPTQTGRVVRDAIPSSCSGKSNSLQNSTAVHYDSYTYTSPTTGCATLTFDHTGCGGNTTEVVAYSSFVPASPALNVIGDSGYSSTGTGSFSFPVTSGTAFTVVVHEITANTGCPSYTFSVNYGTNCRQPGFDRTNDGRADFTIFRPSTGSWITNDSAGGTNSTVQFGVSGDITTSGDYTGDGQTDVSVYRPSNNTFYYGTSQTTPNTSFVGRAFGASGDIPVPGDFDRDGKTDLSVFRPSSGFWYALRSSDNTLQSYQWGQSGDVPFPADFDGDRITDYCLYRPTDTDGQSRFYILESNFAYGFFLRVQYGLPTDKVVPGDYDGDGKADIALWRPSTGTWYIQRTSNGAFAQQFGQSGDVPQPADYDGDKKTDIAVYRPGAQGFYYVSRSATNTVTGVAIGTTGDEAATAPIKIQ